MNDVQVIQSAILTKLRTLTWTNTIYNWHTGITANEMIKYPSGFLGLRVEYNGKDYSDDKLTKVNIRSATYIISFTIYLVIKDFYRDENTDTVTAYEFLKDIEQELSNLAITTGNNGTGYLMPVSQKLIYSEFATYLYACEFKIMNEFRVSL